MKVGLVLEGGGIKGAYQVGSYYAFRDCKIKLQGFVGTSIGAINAAMLASHRERELLDFWYHVNPGLLLGFEQRFVDFVINKTFDLKSLIASFSALKGIVRNLGIDNTKMLSKLQTVIDYDKLLTSDCDFGLVTVRVSRKGIKPIYVKKENIKDQNELIEYLMASCYLPVFRERRILDNHYYIDGGFYDNSPVKLLKDKDYDKLYVINIKGIGFNRKEPKGIKIVHISPSRENGKILEFNQEIVRDNIMMGYYDTLRVLKKLDGFKYCFKVRSEKFYYFITRKVDEKLFRRVMHFFSTDSVKDTVIRALEYILEKEKVSYYDVYSSYKMIKKYRYMRKKHFVYKFIRNIKFL